MSTFISINVTTFIPTFCCSARMSIFKCSSGHSREKIYSLLTLLMLLYTIHYNFGDFEGINWWILSLRSLNCWLMNHQRIKATHPMSLQPFLSIRQGFDGLIKVQPSQHSTALIWSAIEAQLIKPELNKEIWTVNSSEALTVLLFCQIHPLTHSPIFYILITIYRYEDMIKTGFLLNFNLLFLGVLPTIISK